MNAVSRGVIWGEPFCKKVSPQAPLQKLLYMLWLADFPGRKSASQRLI
jgi:hypothetical protein